MHAMMIALPELRTDPEWKARMGALRTTLRPTSVELGEIMREAARRGERLKGELSV